MGSFVRDQVDALRRLPGVDLDVFAFKPGGYAAYVRASRDLGRQFGGERFDVVHAHFGLSTWIARSVAARARAVTLHGTDLVHPRSRLITLAGLPLQDLVGAVSESLAERVPGWARSRRTFAIMPCGVDLHRFVRADRAGARDRLGLDPDGRYLLFGADPARREKRFDRAQQVAGDTRLLTLGAVEPAEVPTWVNAANAVLVTSDRESFGLAALEALACDVPVLSTPVGVAPEALANVPGALCAPFDETAWKAALAPHLAAPDPRIGGRAAVEPYSSDSCAARVLDAWNEVLERIG